MPSTLFISYTSGWRIDGRTPAQAARWQMASGLVLSKVACSASLAFTTSARTSLNRPEVEASTSRMFASLIEGS